MSDMPHEESDRYATILQDGLALHRQGRLDEAAEHYERVLARFPAHPGTLDLHGVLLHQLGRDEEAIKFLYSALSMEPGNAGFLNHLGGCQRAIGQLDGARRSFERALITRPAMPEATLNVAVVLEQLNRYEEAEKAAREAIRLAPESVDARLALSLILRRQDRVREAAGVLTETRRNCPPDARVFETLAQHFTTFGDKPAADNAALRAVLLEPNTKKAYVFFKEASGQVKWAHRLVCVEPDDALLWTNLSNHLLIAAENAASERTAMRAVVLSPALLGGYVNIATSAMRRFDLDRARTAAYRGMKITPDEPRLAICASECERSRGNLVKGLELYERRMYLDDALPRLGLPPAWDRARSLDGPLLVCAEQGVGDEFIFLSCLPDLLADVENVVVECDARCLPLFRRSFPKARWIARTLRQPRPGYAVWDYRGATAPIKPLAHIMAASLPAYARAGLERPAMENGYLCVAPGEATAWRSWLKTLPDRPKVGISWRSGVVDLLHAPYYFTAEMMLDALGPQSATFISLLYTDATAEIAGVHASRGATIHVPPGLDQRDELDRLAALIAQLDMVVTADTSVCAMAAACGVRTIRLEASYMLLSNGRDALFENVYPCRDTEVPFDRARILRRASQKYREWTTL